MRTRISSIKILPSTEFQSTPEVPTLPSITIEDEKKSRPPIPEKKSSGLDIPETPCKRGKSEGGLRISDQLSEYKLKLTNEVLQYFIEMKKMPKIEPAEIIGKVVSIPYKKGAKKRKTVILDLDDTLIHLIDIKKDYSSVKIDKGSRKAIIFKDSNTAQLKQMQVVVRPFVREFLEELYPLYELIVFTAGQESYAKALLNVIDPNDQYFSYKLFRDQCIMKNYVYIKDLRVLMDRDLKNVAIVDNSIIAFMNQLDNGIYVPSFRGDKRDVGLLSVLALLKSLHKSDNLQEELRKRLGISEAYKTYLAIGVKCKEG